jgi:hypothetical protein
MIRAMKAIAIGLALYAHSSWAVPTFGAEFNFTSQDLLEANQGRPPSGFMNDVLGATQERFAYEVGQRCPDCRREERVSRYGGVDYRFHHPDGWWLNVSVDPAVVEVQMSPMTVADIEHHQTEIQRLIFDVARDIWLVPFPDSQNAGHLHMGIESAFGGDALLFRNFVVDWTKYSEMFFQLSGARMENAPTLNMLPAYAEKQFRKVIEDFDLWVEGARPPAQNPMEKLMRWTENWFSPWGKGQEIAALMKTINNRVYDTSPHRRPTEKYQSLNLSHSETVEMRSVHEARSANEFLRLCRLMAGRVEHLKRLKGPLAYQGILEASDPQKAVDLFYDYTLASGMRWDEVRDMMRSGFRALTPRPLASDCERQLRH